MFYQEVMNLLKLLRLLKNQLIQLQDLLLLLQYLLKEQLTNT